MRNKNIYLQFMLLVLAVSLCQLPVTSIAKSKNNGRSAAGTKYVSDNLPITLRTGKSNEHRIIRSLESGTRLRVLGTDKNYTRVRTDQGETGWVLSHYLVDEQVARVLLPPVQDKLEKLTTKYKEMSQELKDVTKERNALKIIAAQYEKLEKRHKKLTEDTTHLREIATKSEELFQEKETLRQKKDSLQSQLDTLLQEIKELRDGNNRLWFLTGAGVIFIGILIGSLLTRNRKGKATSWGAGPDTLMLKQP